MVSVIEQTTPSARSKEREHCSIARTPLLRQGGECCFPRTFTTPLSYWYASCERNIEKLEPRPCGRGYFLTPLRGWDHPNFHASAFFSGRLRSVLRAAPPLSNPPNAVGEIGKKFYKSQTVRTGESTRLTTDMRSIYYKAIDTTDACCWRKDRRINLQVRSSNSEESCLPRTGVRLVISVH